MYEASMQRQTFENTRTESKHNTKQHDVDIKHVTLKEVRRKE